MTLPEPDGPLIYADPPYRGSFTTYGIGFDDHEQRRLAAWCLDRAADGYRVALSNRVVDRDDLFEDLLGDQFEFHYLPVTYTAGRRKRTPDGFEAKPAVEFLAVSRH